MCALKVNREIRSEIIQSLSEKLLAEYVFPETAEQIRASLKEHRESGDYDGIDDGEAFAAALTRHMQEVSRDEHLRMRCVETPLPEHEGSLLQNKEKLAELQQRAQLENYGFHKAERLAGNIGFLDIRTFYRPSWGSGDTAAAAMGFVSSTDALIFDLRKCGGGNPGMVALICSYLFDGEPVHLNSLYWRKDDSTQQYWTLPYVPGVRYTENPVYVLTSSYTFSAGEEFAYNLKHLQRATLIGESTAGGAHPGAPFRLHPYFDVFIPQGRVINPITGTSWEGEGVVPDIPVSAEKALDTAYRMALDTVIEHLGSADTRPLNKLLEEARAARGRCE
ncbi:MAG: S41 family peptidase [Anaerolineales bacterium]|nr:S41 family peptidase [Anaerolineales bacterium]